MNYTREFLLTRLAIAVTVVFTGVFLWQGTEVVRSRIAAGSWIPAVEHVVFVLLALLVMFGAFVYLFARIGFLRRFSEFQPTPHKHLEQFAFASETPSVTFLLPSYKEEIKVIRQAIFSCALQEYANKRVVLLIDDPDVPGDPDLERTRNLPVQIGDEFGVISRTLTGEHRAFVSRSQTADITLEEESQALARVLTDVAQWLKNKALQESGDDHTDKFFIDEVVLKRADSYTQDAVRLIATPEGTSLDVIEMTYRRLISQFDVEIVSFERKRYENLSHASNKAMNLNSYIDLMGRRFSERKTLDKLYIEDASTSKNATIDIPQCDYVVTLDADSILLPEYVLRLVYHMENKGNERVAVAQTPYSAIPGASSTVERLSGATTDIQFIIHQGFTAFNSTFWVGANAVLRKVALDDIRKSVSERGFTLGAYIQDRTVIEDTESTVDLIERGWKLFNYPDRLSYSATPPDFGALLIQRGRWANGGLIILPKLVRYLLRKRTVMAAPEALMRIHYLTSIAAVNISLVAMLFYPFDAPISAYIWLPPAALPYFFLYGRDMTHRGYSWTDLPRVYALNLMLIPVNLTGVLKSIQQALTGQNIPFGRTPKVTGRTAAPWRYVLFEYLLLSYLVVGVIFDIAAQRYLHAAFAGFNALLLLYVVTRLIGIKESAYDVWFGLIPVGKRAAIKRIYDRLSARGRLKDMTDSDGPLQGTIVIASEPAQSDDTM